jgi:hypothetical protein
MTRYVFLTFFIFGCSSNSGSESYFTSIHKGAESVCKVMNEPQQYIGRRIIINGTYFREPHRRIIYDENCPEVSLRVRHSSALDADSAARRALRRSFKAKATGMIPVVYSGILTAKALEPGCNKPDCYEYSFEDAQLLAASTRTSLRFSK